MSNKTGKVIGGIFLAPFILIALGIAYCEANKAYWDHRVKEMCEKDGGVTVFEKVELTKEEYGDLKIPFGWENSTSPYYLSSKPEVIINESPKVWRSEMLLIRRVDNKTLGSQVYIARRGGDIPTVIVAPSHYGCSKVNGVNNDIKNSIFLIKAVNRE